MGLNNKFILDACCGPRMFWFNKQHPNCIYIDNRIEKKGYQDYRPNREIKPDILMDNRDLKFSDKSFKLIILDPPQIISKNKNFRLAKDYGVLNPDTWKIDIKKSFDECWRVLEDYGVLIFKWNETSIKKRELLEILKKEPLIGHSNSPVFSKKPTFWFCFMKIPENDKS